MSDFPAVTWRVFSFPYSHVKFLTLHQANTIVLNAIVVCWTELFAADFEAHTWNKASLSVSPECPSAALCFYGEQTPSSPWPFCHVFFSFSCYLLCQGGAPVRKNASATWYSIFVVLEECTSTLSQSSILPFFPMDHHGPLYIPLQS